MGLAPPLNGEYEQTQQTAATDMVTLTGAASMTGDFVVAQNSTGAELFVLRAASATTVDASVKISPTSTGAIAAGGFAPNGFLVYPSSKAVIAAAYAYDHASSMAGSCEFLIASGGSKAPSYFMGVGCSAGDPGTGTPIANGYFDDSLKVNTFTCDHPFVGLKCMAGSLTFYLLGARATGIT